VNEISQYYPSNYYFSWEQSSEPLSWDEILRRRAYQLTAKAKWLDMQPGRLLDVGAQKGEFVWHMRSKGWQAEGIEVDAAIPNPGNQPIRYGDFLTLDLGSGEWDAVTFWAVLEHVHSPKDFVRRASELLRPGGRLVGLVTNFNSIQARWYRADDYPRHLTVFTANSLRRLCASHGLTVSRFSTDQTVFGGALNGGLLFVVKRLLGYTVEEAFREWKQVADGELFYSKWRGRTAPWVRQVSRLDRALTLPLEWILDRLGFGFNLTFVAEKKHNS
jgi:2-polyprenyl-3-methyl-5-hydroxy-6-metoxy-1,4-benzoquinol methylase